MDTGDLEYKCEVWRRLGPFDSRLEFEASLLARDICEAGLRGRDSDLTRRLRRLVAEADSIVHKQFFNTPFNEGRLAEIRDVLAEYRRDYYGPLRRHVAPSPERQRWWLWLDEVAGRGALEPRGSFGAPSPRLGPANVSRLAVEGRPLSCGD